MTTALAILVQAVDPPSALPRSLQSTSVAPIGFSDPFNPKADPTLLSGFISDAPTLFSRPIALSLDNILILASFNLSGPIADTPISTVNRQVTQMLFDSLQPSGKFIPDLRNAAEDKLNIVATDLQATIITIVAEETAAEETSTVSPIFPDFNNRPTEQQAFGSTCSAVPDGTDLTTLPLQRVALAGGESVTLADLLVDTPAGAITDVAVRLQGPTLGTPGGVLKDGGGTTVGNDIVIPYADLANYTYEAPTGKVMDYLSLIGLSDPGSDSTYDERGSFQTVALSSNGTVEPRLDGTERIIDYNFQTEGGVSFSQITLTFEDINSLGYTDAESAVEDGKLRVKINGIVAEGEDPNEATVDLYASSGNTIVGRFVSPGTSNGIDVEVRSLDSNFDITGISVRAAFE